MSIDKLKTKFFTGAWLTDVKHYFTKINEIIDYLNSNPIIPPVSYDPGYKIYSALLSQSGSNPPVITELQNTLGGTVTPYRNNPGEYFLFFSETLTSNQTSVLPGLLDNSTHTATLQMQLSPHYLYLNTNKVIDQTGTDGLLSSTAIEIKVYP